MNVSDLFTKPSGPVRLDPEGKFWVDRSTTGLNADGEITILIADGERVASITGSPFILHRLAEAIEAQVDSAIANTDRGSASCGAARDAATRGKGRRP